MSSNSWLDELAKQARQGKESALIAVTAARDKIADVGKATVEGWNKLSRAEKEKQDQLRALMAAPSSSAPSTSRITPGRLMLGLVVLGGVGYIVWRRCNGGGGFGGRRGRARSQDGSFAFP